MFNVTRAAAAMTKIERRAVKLVGQGKIKLDNATDGLKLLNEAGTQKAPHSKNILKRAYNWCKTFISNYKKLNSGIKQGIKAIKDTWDEATMGKLTKKNIKEVKTTTIDVIKMAVKSFKEEIKGFLDAGKTAGKGAGKKAGDVAADLAEGAANAAK